VARWQGGKVGHKEPNAPAVRRTIRRRSRTDRARRARRSRHLEKAPLKAQEQRRRSRRGRTHGHGALAAASRRQHSARAAHKNRLHSRGLVSTVATTRHAQATDVPMFRYGSILMEVTLVKRLQQCSNHEHSSRGARWPARRDFVRHPLGRARTGCGPLLLWAGVASFTAPRGTQRSSAAEAAAAPAVLARAHPPCWSAAFGLAARRPGAMCLTVPAGIEGTVKRQRTSGLGL